MSDSETYPPGYMEEYDGYRLTAVSIAFLVLDTAFVALRFYARYLQKRKLMIDDWIMIPALLFCAGNIGLALAAIEYGGVGRHVQYVAQDYDMFRTWYQICMIATPVIYIFAAALPKLSILALYLQIFIDKWSRWGTYATMAAIIANVIVMIPISVYKCNPISYGWNSLLNPELQGGWCANIEPRLQWGSFANIVTDVSMLLLPLPTLYRLKANRSTKVGLLLTFGMAIAGLVASCLRFAAFFATQAYSDGTWSSVTLVTWCIVEPGIYMFVASQMAFHPLMVALMRTSWGLKLKKRYSITLTTMKTSNRTSWTNRLSQMRRSTRSTSGRNTMLEKSTTDPESNLTSNRGSTFSTQTPHSMHPASMDVERLEPPAHNSLFDSTIWISRDFTVENCSAPSSREATRDSFPCDL